MKTTSSNELNFNLVSSNSDVNKKAESAMFEFHENDILTFPTLKEATFISQNISGTMQNIICFPCVLSRNGENFKHYLSYATLTKRSKKAIVKKELLEIKDFLAISNPQFLGKSANNIAEILSKKSLKISNFGNVIIEDFKTKAEKAQNVPVFQFVESLKFEASSDEMKFLKEIEEKMKK